MDRVGQKLNEWSLEDRRREEAVRPGPPFGIAAAKALRLLGRSSDEKTAERLGLAFHYGLAVGWAPTYALLRRRTKLRSARRRVRVGNGAVAEGNDAGLPLQRPNRAYPLSTHVRALLAHLAFGAAVAVVTETAWRLHGRTPNQEMAMV
jgi:hypothetical protein